MNSLTRTVAAFAREGARALLRVTRRDRTPVARPVPEGTSRPAREGLSRPPEFDYAPHRDGDPDPGEVVWTWVPYEDDASRGKDRPVLVLARAGDDVVVAPLSSQDHDRDAADEARWGRQWMDIGSGDWDSRRRPSEVRLDRLLRVAPDTVRREGGVLDERIFRAVVARMRELHGAV